MVCLIDGKAIAASVIEDVKRASTALQDATGIRPGLGVVIVGTDPASHAYVAAKSRMAKACNFHSVQHSLPAETSQDALEALVGQLNADPAIHGILVQLPLPAPLRFGRVIAAIRPEKDVDGLSASNAGKLLSGDFATGLIPCTPAGAMRLVSEVHGSDLAGLEAVVIGRSNLFGKPMAQLLLAADATVTMAHSRTPRLAEVCRRADILVAAVGRPEMVRGDWIKPGATVIDVGINRRPALDGTRPSTLVGDVDLAAARAIAGAVTPVPGGVGPMTIAMLMRNTLLAAERAASGRKVS